MPDEMETVPVSIAPLSALLRAAENECLMKQVGEHTLATALYNFLCENGVQEVEVTAEELAYHYYSAGGDDA